MDENIDRWRRLGRCVVARREELGLTQEDVRARGGPSTSTMRNIEGYLKAGYRSMIFRRLELALEWEPGSVDAIKAGGEPTPTRKDQEPARTQDPITAKIEASPISRREKDIIIAELQRIRDRQHSECEILTAALLRIAEAGIA